MSELRDRGVAATRQLAKRQLTWLRSFPGIEPIAPDAGELERRVAS
jgi:tRNA dimethylallyltransferase